jgi:hypothetical protein
VHYHRRHACCSAPSGNPGIRRRNDWPDSRRALRVPWALARAIVAHRHERYRLATAAERTASHDAQLAARSRDSLRREWVAAVQATEVHHSAPASRPAARSTRLAVRARVA